VQQSIKEGYGYAVDIDLSKFFDKVDHDLLMNRLGKWVTDQQLLALIGKYLRADVSIKGQLEVTSLWCSTRRAAITLTRQHHAG
jgi:RNA-directed DNA polymerase